MAETAALGEALRTLVMRSRKAVDRLLAGEGSSYTRTKWLLFISSHGPLRSTDLADAFGLAPRTVTEAIDALERDGLVRRDPDPKDRRAKRISITPAGGEVVAWAEPVVQRFFEQVFSALDNEEQVRLASLLGRLTDRLDMLERESGQEPDPA
ncbi:MarR family winged helix-turn-helix transcriptional regulator [Flavisphingomonas formosensis]|uniref:MarR family winged helix-turn-helix transcriptional regulator n=1 Tax=Flavisphingomonas formosensis TaxID=861534 RepID=UPI001E479FDD|nr:MarR family transcriptional regulator [Sphingomonas formosensis]